MLPPGPGVSQNVTPWAGGLPKTLPPGQIKEREPRGPAGIVEIPDLLHPSFPQHVCR